MTEPQQLQISIPGVRLAAKAWGPEDAPLVLCLHGWLDNAATYDGLAPLLPGLRLVALDMPGHGLSSHHAPGYLYAFTDLVGDVFWAIERMGWTRFALMGHSLGAAVALCLAGAFPDRVARLVLLEGLGPLTDPAAQAPVRLARALNEQRRKAGRPLARYASAEELAQKLGATFSNLTDASIRTLLRRGLMDNDDGTVSWRTDRRLRFASRFRLGEEQVLAFIRAITAPSLLVRAKNGIPLDSDRVQARVSAFSNLRIEEVAGHHHVHLDYPHRVAPAVAEFLSALTREPSA